MAETLVLEGERYRAEITGERDDTRQHRKKHAGYVDYYVMCSCWGGTAVIRDVVTGRERRVRFTTESLDGPEDNPYGGPKDVLPVYPLEQGFMCVHRDGYAVKPDFVVDRRKVVDLVLENLLKQADDPEYKDQLEFEPDVYVKPLQIEELVARCYVPDADGQVRLLTEQK